MADTESSGYPADGISEKDEIVTATKPDVNSTTMDDPREDSQFEDAESDFNSPAHSATKSPMHSLRDEDSRDSGINHSESGSDRPEKQDLPELQYEDADMDSNADPEEDNEPLDSKNGQSETEYNEHVHDNGEYCDGDAAEGYMENDSPEENYVQEQDNMQIDSNFVDEVDLDRIDDVPESQPEDEINMQEVLVEGGSKSEEDVVEKYEEEEVQEKFKQEDEQFREEFEYYVSKDDQHNKPEEDYNDDQHNKPEEDYSYDQHNKPEEDYSDDQHNKPEEDYSEAVVDLSEEVEHVGVAEVEEYVEDVPYELPESQLDDGSGEAEGTEPAVPDDVLDEDYTSRDDFVETIMPETDEFTNEIIMQANNIYSQQRTELDKPMLEHESFSNEEDSISAPEANHVPKEADKYEEAESEIRGHYDIPANDAYDEHEGVPQDHYNFHPDALEPENESSPEQDLPKTEYTNLSKVNDMPESMNIHGAISSVEQFVDNVGADVKATEKVADVSSSWEQNTQKHSSINANIRQTPRKVYTNFDDIPVGMASSYIYQPPKQSDSAEEDQDREKFESAQSKRKPQGDAVMRRGRGRGVGKAKQPSQVAVKGNVQARTNISMNTVDIRTMKPASNVEDSQSMRQPSARSSESRQLNPTDITDSRETKFVAPLDVDVKQSSLQEPKEKQDTPGTAVRVIRQSRPTRATSKSSLANNSNSKSPVSSMTRVPVRKDEKGSLNKGMNPASRSLSNTPEKLYVKPGDGYTMEEDEWKDHSAERLANHARHAIGKDGRPVSAHRVQHPRPASDKYMGINQQHLDPRVNQHGKDPYGRSYGVDEIKQKNEEKLKLSPGIARRQIPHDPMNEAPMHALPDNISQAQSRRYAEYGMTNYSQPPSKDYEYPESLDIEAESRHSSTNVSPYHQPHTQLWQQKGENGHDSMSGTPNNVTPTHHLAHHSHDSEEPESEHQPKCTCGQVVYDDIAESQAYLIERNKRKVAERAAELQAKKDERLKRDGIDSKEQDDGDIFLRPTNRRRNSYELANRDHSPTPDHEGNKDIDMYGTNPGRPVRSKKDLEEPASSRRYKVFDVDDTRKENRGLSAVDHATLAKLAERELADMERSRAVRDRGQPIVMSSPQKSPVNQAISPARSSQASPMTQSPKKQSSKTTSPAKSSSHSSPVKTLPISSKNTPSPSKSNDSAKSAERIEMRLSGLDTLELNEDFGSSRLEDDQFMDADEESDEDGVAQQFRQSDMSRWYSDADKLTFHGDDGAPVSSSSMNDIQTAISESKTKLLKSPTFYVEQEPEEPVWILRPFYAKKQIQDEERKKQGIEREKERERSTVRQPQRHSVSPGSIGSSDEDVQNRNPQGYLRKQESEDEEEEDDDVEQKPLMSPSDYDHGIPPDHVHSEECYLRNPRPRQATESLGPDLPPSGSKTKEVLEHGIIYPAAYLGSTQLICNKPPSKKVRMQQAQEAVNRIKAPEDESQPSTEVDLFISTERVKVLNAESEETMMDHPLKSISYIADIGNVLVIMARRRSTATTLEDAMEESGIAMGDQVSSLPMGPKKVICHVFDTEDAQLIAQSIGQAFSIAYLRFLKENGIDDPSVAEMDYSEVLNSQEIYGDDLMLFSKKECEKEILIEKERGEIMGIVIVESGWGSLIPTVVIANMSPFGAAARSGKLNIGDQIMTINGVSCVGLPLATVQQHIKSLKTQCLVKFNVVSCPPVTQVIIKRPDIKYQLGFSVQNGTICSLMRGGIAERGGVRVGHRIIEINGMSVVATPHEKIVDILATAVGEIHMKTMPLSMYRLLTGQEQPAFL